MTVVRFAPSTSTALAELLLSMADDEFVIGFSDSEWTGIAPILEEDVAMSSIAQDELGHAKALYELLASVHNDGRDADALAYDREPEAYRHARLLDHRRGDWALAIARRFLYDTADAARLASIGDGWPPLGELIAKIRREERYHVMHALAWADRLARAGGEARERFVAALEALAPDAPTVLATPEGEAALLEAGILTRPMSAAFEGWRTEVAGILVPLGITLRLEAPADAAAARTGHSDDFRWLWGEFTSVRRSDPGATW
ncbi:MAG: phenylacetate-CoA oxygenase subunit PaaI [Chloroflexota bacterium]|nr:MAG: phenylacetate-CoA oxygenase subunit PaaI [Chloroflexota bacterium]